MNQGNQILETDIPSGEIIALWATLFGIAISLLAAHNARLRNDINKNQFFNLKIEQQIIIISKIILFLTFIYFLYVAYINYRDRDKFDSVANRDLLIQLIASILVVIASILTSYVIFNNYRQNETSYENPEI